MRRHTPVDLGCLPGNLTGSDTSMDGEPETVIQASLRERPVGPLGRVAAHTWQHLPRTQIHGDTTMRRVIVPALLAIALVATSSVNASAGLFDKMCGNNCDSCCDVEPTCGCEPTCCAAEPACGCEVADPCCDSGCGGHRKGFLKRLFSKHHNGCDSCCDIEPACGCEAPAPCCAVEPACGCEVVDPCCDSGCGGHRKGFLKRLFSKHTTAATAAVTSSQLAVAKHLLAASQLAVAKQSSQAADAAAETSIQFRLNLN